jgi:hypothetical protein
MHTFRDEVAFFFATIPIYQVCLSDLLIVSCIVWLAVYGLMSFDLFPTSLRVQYYHFAIALLFLCPFGRIVPLYEIFSRVIC